MTRNLQFAQRVCKCFALLSQLVRWLFQSLNRAIKRASSTVGQFRIFRFWENFKNKFWALDFWYISMNSIFWMKINLAFERNTKRLMRWLVLFP